MNLIFQGGERRRRKTDASLFLLSSSLICLTKKETANLIVLFSHISLSFNIEKKTVLEEPI
jgi:hypothetical protein